MTFETFTEKMIWGVLAVLVLNIFQRRYQTKSHHKRLATIYISALILVLNIIYVMIIQYELPRWLAIPALLVPIGFAFLFRSKIMIFRRKCVSCGKPLDIQTILYMDHSLCGDCHRKIHPEEYTPTPTGDEGSESQDAEGSGTKGDEVIHPYESIPQRDVSEIDWDLWEPVETAVLCYLFDDQGHVLLIEKRRGLGHGLINAPGGRIEADETAAEAAVRETAEETGLTPLDPQFVGRLDFQFVDGYALRGYVFFSHAHTGEMVDTDEAFPFWCKVDEIPYDRMWEDDSHWLPQAISGKEFSGRFIFDDRTMVSSSIDYRDPAGSGEEE